MCATVLPAFIGTGRTFAGASQGPNFLGSDLQLALWAVNPVQVKA